MSRVSSYDGQYALDCWLDEDDESDPTTEYAECVGPLKERASRLLEAGRYRYLELSRWDAKEGDRVNLFVFTPD